MESPKWKVVGGHMEFEKVWGRVKEATNLASFTELSSVVGVKQSAVSKIKKRGDFPPGWIFILANKYGLNSDWLASGEGPRRKNDGSPYMVAEPAAPYGSEGNVEYVHIPRYEVNASAGGGAIVHSEQVVDYLSFRADWVRSTLGVSVRDLVLISVIGDSMEPSLSEGDVVLLDMTTTSVLDGSIYALQLNGGLLVKRIQRMLDGSLVVKSDNARYDTETVSEDKADRLKIIGRVVWVGRRL